VRPEAEAVARLFADAVAQRPEFEEENDEDERRQEWDRRRRTRGRREGVAGIRCATMPSWTISSRKATARNSLVELNLLYARRVAMQQLA